MQVKSLFFFCHSFQVTNLRTSRFEMHGTDLRFPAFYFLFFFPKTHTYVYWETHLIHAVEQEDRSSTSSAQSTNPEHGYNLLVQKPQDD